MTTDEIMALLKRLRNTPNWMRESYGSLKDCMLTYDRAPFEAADAIEALQADAMRWRWAKVFVSGDDNDEANKRTALLAAQYFVGVKDVDTAIDAAMALDKS